MKTIYLLLLLTSVSFAQTADIIFTNADIYTGGHFSTPSDAFTATDGPRPKSIAITNGKIVAIGGDEVLTHKGTKTLVVDLAGKFVMPGFNDAHCHLANGGQAKLEVDVVGVKSLDEMKQRIENMGAVGFDLRENWALRDFQSLTVDSTGRPHVAWAADYGRPRTYVAVPDR